MRFFKKQKRKSPTSVSLFATEAAVCCCFFCLFVCCFCLFVLEYLFLFFCFLLQSAPISCAGHSAPPSLLLRTTVMGPSGKALIMFHASNRVMSCRLIPWTCNTSSPLCRPLCSAAPPEISKRHCFNNCPNITITALLFWNQTQFFPQK